MGTPIRILAFRFMPFANREDTVIGIRFFYNEALVEALKASLRRHRTGVPSGGAAL